MKQLLLLTSFFLIHATFAAHEMPKVEMPKEFDTLKALVGTWEGISKGGDSEEKMTVSYELTSNSTALVETIMPGTPHAMVSIYHKDGKKLAMTHYCALGNQPHLPLKKVTGNTMAFEMTKPVGISSKKEHHMHALTLTFETPDTIKHEWVNFKDGKKSETVVFTLTRKKG